MDYRENDPGARLDGWSFAYKVGPADREIRSAADIEAAGLQAHPCSVPGNLEFDLRAIGEIKDPLKGMNILDLRKYESAHIWYFTRFAAQDRPGFAPELVFEGTDCFSDIYLNGELLGSTDNMLVEHTFSVKGLLEADNELLVHIRPAVEEAKRFEYPANVAAFEISYESLYVRKAPHMYGWDIMPRAVSPGGRRSGWSSIVSG